MQHHLIKSVMYFQILFYSNFRKMTLQLREILLLLSIGHLFGLYNPMIRAMENYYPTATNGGLKNIITQSEAEMC